MWSLISSVASLVPSCPPGMSDTVCNVLTFVFGFLGLVLVCAVPVSGILWFLMIGKGFKMMFAQRKPLGGCLVLLLAAAIPAVIIYICYIANN